MMTMDERQLVLLTKAQYGEEVGASVKTVERWLAAGLLPGAARRDGRWRIPSGTPRPPADSGATSRDVAPVAPSGATSRDVVLSPEARTSPLGMLGTLQDAAGALGTTVGGVRRMARDGLLVVGPYGPHGALRVYVPARDVR